MAVDLYHKGCRATFPVHRLVAKAFIPNIDPMICMQVDHRDRCKTNNHVSNLRWVSRSSNCFNTASRGNRKYEYFDEVPKPFVQVSQFGRWIFDRLYYSGATDKFYFMVDDDRGYRILIPCEYNENYYLYVYDESGEQRKVNFVKLGNCAIMELEAKYITGTQPQEDLDDIIWA